MGKLKILLIFIIIIFSVIFLSIDKFGGNFKGEPEQLYEDLSQGAKLLIMNAYKDVNSSSLTDYHTHVVGLNHNHGTTVNPRLLSWWHPIDKLKTKIYMSGSAVKNIEKSNEEYLTRLVKLIKSNPVNIKHHILAFDHNYNLDGTINYDKSEFYVSNEYIWKIYNDYPEIFVPVISVHPARKDAIQELEKWARRGVKWVKWLPNAQNIDASLPEYDEFYSVIKKYDMVLLTHTGEEKAVKAEEDQRLGNPLLFKRPLDIGVKVVMAHCASLGSDEDLDNPGNKLTSFDLFIRMMDNPKYKGLLFGEISAITQFNRLPDPLLTLLERQDLHSRLINGSDYPLPALNIVIQTRSLVKYGFITKKERQYLNEIYGYNPLIFEYVLKRVLKHPKLGVGFDKYVFLNSNVN